LALYFALRVYRRRYRAEILAVHRPICVVFAGMLVVVLLDLLVNGRVYSIVTLHVTAWYVFVLHQFSRRAAADPAPPRFGWKWIRTTRSGFQFLHLGLLALAMIGAGVWAYGFDNSPSQVGFSAVLSRDAFPYWTIFHVTTSFTPR